MTKYAACIEYDGTDYHGWQRLKDSSSVQEEVEKALETYKKAFACEFPRLIDKKNIEERILKLKEK